MIEPIKEWGRKHKIKATILVVLANVVMLLLLVYLTQVDNKSIDRLLAEQGYNVESIEFTLLDSYSENNLTTQTYTSSEPIEYKPGYFVDLWEFQKVLIANKKVVTAVQPYVENPTQYVDIDVELPQDVYDKLAEMVGEENIAEFVQEVMNKMADEFQQGEKSEPH